MKVNKAKTTAQRKKIERENWRNEGGTYKEIKLTESAASILITGRKKQGFKKDWEFIDFLLREYNNRL